MKRIFNNLLVSGASGLHKIARSVIRRFSKKRISNYRLYQELFCNKCGIEIGGPSSFFRHQIPIYKKLKSLDGVNFSSSTIWEGEINEGKNYKYGKCRRGYQFICDATNLDRIESGKYDFVLSCNNLEHVANPLKALNEWLRIIKPQGLLLLVIPNKDSNFDHNRSITGMAHLVEDFTSNVSEEDMTHLDEILTLHDLSMDPPAGDFENFKKRSLNNFQNRCFHHHVFDSDLLEQIFRYFNIELLLIDCTKTDFIIAGRKT
jgi:SAM-dependent methyltransferase